MLFPWQQSTSIIRNVHPLVHKYCLTNNFFTFNVFHWPLSDLVLPKCGMSPLEDLKNGFSNREPFKIEEPNSN
eukprot:c27673_g2_i1 orf=84-302(+)